MADRGKNRKKSSDSSIIVRGSPAKDSEFLQFKQKYFELKQRYGKEFGKFFKMEEEYLIPCSIFNKELSTLESVSKYLVENSGLRVSYIAKMFNRTNKTIWQAYNSASKKVSKKFVNISSKFWIPASLFSDRKFSVLEHVVVYLKTNYTVSFKDIAGIVFRNITTVRTVYYRAMKKGGKK